jgi:CheY-like chemotaxis protein
MDGYAVARALRADPAFRATRLVALTGYGREQDKRLAREAGFDVHLTKPADAVRILNSLEGARSLSR